MKIEGKIVGVDEEYDHLWEQSYFEGFLVEVVNGDTVTVDFELCSGDNYFGDEDFLDNLTNDEFIEHMKTFIGKKITAYDCSSSKFYASEVEVNDE